MTSIRWSESTSQSYLVVRDQARHLGVSGNFRTCGSGSLPTIPESQAHRGSVMDGDWRRYHFSCTRHLWGAFVELIGIEPTTSGLQSQRSPN